MKLLVVDDDKELCALLNEFLSREGFEVALAHDGQHALEYLLHNRVDLAIFDVMLPRPDGLSLLRAVRRESKVPVIMLTARGEDVDRILGLELGADDYLPKPFNARELVARIRAVIRRLRPAGEAAERIEVEGITLDVAAREVRCDGQFIDLTTVEFDILEMLMRSSGRVLTRDQIMDKMYGRTAGPLDRSIDVHISHLRRKLGPAANCIKTIRGLGYQLTRPGQAEEVEP